MDDPRPPAPGDEDPKIADAASLFGDPLTKVPEPSAPPPPGGTGAASEAYEIEDIAPSSPSPLAVNAASAWPEDGSTFTPTRPASIPDKAPRGIEPGEAVEQVWSRVAEWAGSIVALTAAGLVLAIVFYAMVNAEAYTLAFMTLVAGTGLMLLLCYPILITLERPVRITPEQAVRDYYAALSHHAPHYRRMWLLLSRAGRISGSFGSFEGFKRYWKERLGKLREGHASGWTPLKFQVEDFRSEKSAGKLEIAVSFVVQVTVRGRQSSGPVATLPVKTTLVKGPDKMWYLDRGTLP